MLCGSGLLVADRPRGFQAGGGFRLVLGLQQLWA